MLPLLLPAQAALAKAEAALAGASGGAGCACAFQLGAELLTPRIQVGLHCRGVGTWTEAAPACSLHCRQSCRPLSFPYSYFLGVPLGWLAGWLKEGREGWRRALVMQAGSKGSMLWGRKYGLHWHRGTCTCHCHP